MITEAEYEVLRAQQQAKTGKRQEKFAEVEAMPVNAVVRDKPKRKGELLSIAIFLPIRLISEMNTSEHWTKYAKRNKAQQAEVTAEWYRLTRNAVIGFPCVVRLTRIGKKRMDSDNLISSGKHIRDAICNCLGVDDGDEARVTFEYYQELSSYQYGVRIEVRKV